MLTNLPNLLTLSRVAAIPLIVAMFYVDGNPAHWIAMAIFTAAAITDYLDGYLARSRSELSNFGKFMDPIADKLLVASTLMLLVAFDRMTSITVVAAVIILCREFLVSGLREFLADLHVGGVPVSPLAKWKTMFQMVSIGFLIVGSAGPDIIPSQAIGEVGLWIAAGLTLVTGFNYLRASARFFEGADAQTTSDQSDKNAT